MKILHISSKEEMSNIARKMAKEAKVGDVFALSGTLGVGKSFFAKSFIDAIKNEELEVLSPTFNLVLNYQSDKAEIFHFDLYRLKSKEELENIGFFDSIANGITLIEWPEMVLENLQKLTKNNCHFLKIDFAQDKSISDESRIITISGSNSDANSHLN